MPLTFRESVNISTAEENMDFHVRDFEGSGDHSACSGHRGETSNSMLVLQNEHISECVKPKTIGLERRFDQDFLRFLK